MARLLKRTLACAINRVAPVVRLRRVDRMSYLYTVVRPHLIESGMY
jgi:hypothetical protein